ncbi:MAG: LolA family protein [Limisphaerales bacterium]
MVSLRSHLAGVLIWLAVADPVMALDTNSVIDAIIAHQSVTKSWHAKFVQIRKLPSLKKALKTPGKVWFQGSGEFRWELGDPARSVAIRSGEQITILSPRLRLAEVYPLGTDTAGPWRDALALLEVGFPRSRESLEDKFILSQVEKIDRGHAVVLLPRKKSARQFLTYIRMEFDAAHGLRATEMAFSHGARIRTEFSLVKQNPSLDNALFDSTVPEGYEVSRPLPVR